MELTIRLALWSGLLLLGLALPAQTTEPTLARLCFWVPPERMAGFERTAAVIRKGCGENLSAEGLLERLMGEVKEFRGETPQGDDQTVVVVEVKDTPTKGNKPLPKEDES